MTHLEIISSIFENHEIFKFPNLKYEKMNKSKKHPISEGITFESLEFAGEIFSYDGEMKYYELEFLIFKNEKYYAKIIEKLNKTELNKFITKFLAKKLLELKK
jgi:hypothetical protein